MAASRLTEAQVHAACIDIAALGERPTALKLLEELGRGSLTTISKYLNTWNATDQAQTIKAEALPAVIKLLPELAKDGEDLIKKVWNTAKALSDAELEIQREALKQAEVANRAQVEEAFKFSEAQAVKIEQLDDALTAMNKDLASEHLDLTQTRDKLNDAEKFNVGLSKDNDQLTLVITDLKQKIADLEKLNTALAERKQALQESHDKALKQKDAEHSNKDVELVKLSVRYESVALELTKVKVDLEEVSKAAAAAGNLVSNLEGQLKVYQSLDNSQANQS